MGWQEDIDRMEKLSLKEIEDKISEHNNFINESALDSMNKIHWILALTQDNQEKIDKIREIEKVHHNLVMKGATNYIDKSEKEKFINDPESYKEQRKSMHKVSAKFSLDLNRGDEGDN